MIAHGTLIISMLTVRVTSLFCCRGGFKRGHSFTQNYTSPWGLFNWLKLGDSLKRGTAQTSEMEWTQQPRWTGTRGLDTDLARLAAVQTGLWSGRRLWRYSRIKSWSAHSRQTPAERPRPLAGERQHQRQNWIKHLPNWLKSSSEGESFLLACFLVISVRAQRGIPTKG